jgi:hypothetical protein
MEGLNEKLSAQDYQHKIITTRLSAQDHDDMEYMPRKPRKNTKNGDLP